MDHYSTQWLDDNYIAMRRAIEANSITRRATSIGEVHNSTGESYFHIVIPTELDQEYKGERTYAWTQADIIPDLTDHIITVITIDDDVDFSKTKTTYDLVKNAFASQSFDLDTPWEEVASWISQNLVTKLAESTRQNKYKKLTLEEAKKVLEDNNYLVEYIDAPKGPSTFGKSEYTVDYNWWPSDRPGEVVARQDTVWLENPDDDDEVINALSDILREGSPEVEILSVN